MRTSIIFIAVAFAVLLLSMGIYDEQLHSAFKNGTYKLPFNDYVSSSFTGFKNINLKSASTLNIKIEKGPYRILTNPSVNEFVKMNMNGDTLEIETVFPDDYHNYNFAYAIYIWCPQLSSIRSNAYYHIRSREYLDRQSSEYFSFRSSTIDGFTQDSINISATNASCIRLVNNNIENLHAEIGLDSGSATNFYIGEKNHFDHTNIDVRNHSRFWIGDADTSQSFHYTLADSARIIVSGRANHVIKKLQ